MLFTGEALIRTNTSKLLNLESFGWQNSLGYNFLLMQDGNSNQKSKEHFYTHSQQSNSEVRWLNSNFSISY